MSDTIELVDRSLSTAARREFERRVGEQAKTLVSEIEAGQLDSPDHAVGLELEVYAVDRDGRLAVLPDDVFETCNKELGLHNAELNTTATRFDASGLSAQAEALADAVETARAAFDAAGLELVLDAMWTIPPREGTRDYLSSVQSTDGVTIAQNMRPNARYYALDNSILVHAGGEVELDLPGFVGTFPTILPEALTSSIQPHLQVPSTAAFPRYYNLAIRTMAPVLALSTNSPFLPADLYTAVDDPMALVEATYDELRVPVFEQSVNAGDDKVRFPHDIEAAADVVDRIETDATRAPFLREWVEDDAIDGFRDGIWELDHKRGTYWRWLRGIPGGQPVGTGTERSLRLEYRPLPTQPTVRDIVGLQWLTVGLIRGLVAADHPLDTLAWSATRESFYDVVRRGLDADLAWVDADGDRTDDPAVVFEEVFALARAGLEAAGIAADEVARYVGPIEARWEARRTPSRWKREQVRMRLRDGAELSAAIEGMQRDYIQRSRSGTPFSAWD